MSAANGIVLVITGLPLCEFWGAENMTGEKQPTIPFLQVRSEAVPMK